MLAKDCYWSAAESPPIRYKSDEEYFEHLRALLDEAVAARLRSAFPVGSHLSGGLDSSTVAVLAARQLRARGETPHHGFSWSPPPAEHEFPLADTDERAYVQMICEAESIVPVYTPSPPEDLLTAFLWDITRYPFHTLIYEISTSRIAEAMGIRVMLSGWGGDETVAFNGRGYFADLLRRGRWITMTRELALRTRLHEDNFWGSFKSRAILPLLPEWVIRRARPTLAGILYKPLPVKLLEPEFAALLSRTQLYPRLNTRERPGARKNQIRLINNGHLTYRLESWEINGGHNGIEYRYPLLDKRVVEFSLGVPEYLFHYRGWKRYLLREATNGILPAEVRWKKNKNEPAMSKASQSGASEALSSLYQIFNDRRTEIKRAAYINDEALLSRIQKLLEEQKIPPYDEVFRVIWLANLNRSA